MKLAIMQPYFMPYIGYWQLMAAVDKYVVYDDVNFIKRGWINRNNILVNGQPYLFSIALKEASQNKLIKEIEIADDFSKLRKTIEMAYKKAPYFEILHPLLDSIFEFEDKNLAHFLFNSLTKVAEYLNLQTEFVLSSNLCNNKSLKGEDKIIDICRLLNATEYYNAIGGQELYHVDRFLDNQLVLNFLQPHLKPYKQYGTEFVSGLSMIDVLMFNSPTQVRYLLNDYELI